MKSRLRIKGNDRGLLMLCRDVRRRWLQYGENRKAAKQISYCENCLDSMAEEIDHIKPIGKRPRKFEDLGVYAKKMFTQPCQALCLECHQTKTKGERK